MSVFTAVWFQDNTGNKESGSHGDTESVLHVLSFLIISLCPESPKSYRLDHVILMDEDKTMPPVSLNPSSRKQVMVENSSDSTI